MFTPLSIIWSDYAKITMSYKIPCDFCLASIGAAFVRIEALAIEKGLFGKTFGGLTERSFDPEAEEGVLTLEPNAHDMDCNPNQRLLFGDA